MSDWIVGLDLSLASTGGVAVPTDWGGDWSRVRSMVAGYKTPTRKAEKELRASDPLKWEASRRRDIASEAESFIWRALGKRGARVHVVVEGMHVERNLDVVKGLSMLRGAIYSMLLHCHLSTGSANCSRLTWGECTPSQWRALLHGSANGSSEQVKAQTKLVLETAGCPRDWNGDIRDAMGCANWGLRNYPGQFFASPSPEYK